METVELERPKNKIKNHEFSQEKYLNLSKYNAIPALEEAIAESDIGPFNSTEELSEYFHKHWDDF